GESTREAENTRKAENTESRRRKEMLPKMRCPDEQWINKQCAGASAIDLAVTCGLVALIAATATLSIHTLLRARELHGAAADVVRFLDAAALRGAASRTDLRVDFIVAGGLRAGEVDLARSVRATLAALREEEDSRLRGSVRSIALPRSIECDASFGTLRS